MFMLQILWSLVKEKNWKMMSITSKLVEHKKIYNDKKLLIQNLARKVKKWAQSRYGKHKAQNKMLDLNLNAPGIILYIKRWNILNKRLTFKKLRVICHLKETAKA